MPYIDATGVKLYFEEAGDGHPIIFLHELGSDSRQWETQVRYFSRSYRCITFNARGYAPSDAPRDPALYGWELAVNDIAAVMRGLVIEQAHLVGSSMGGYAALQFGLRFPQRASAIVAAGVGAGSAPSERDAWSRETSILARAFIERGMDAMARKMAHGQTRIQLKYKDTRGWQEFWERLRHHSPLGLSNTMARCQALRPSLHDLADQFGAMRIPALLAVGDEDVPCLETNLMLKTVLPNAGLWICPNTGHTINLEEQAAFNAQLDSFLAAVERGSWRRGRPEIEAKSNLKLEMTSDTRTKAVAR
ncbi:alpha/beta hydrolase [Bradyrhizobium sp. CCGUVB1N3]|uniref:alpha/beta fold hydrolase n=1 Tax=Bradyrhizobium sp. CCGUVB1N3 TaxID=2949629 RepID=UPI0020B2759E|nr:alpha/beta hydrolase [Bradyrhizobium sp. CCGUVB1N3]MCP3476484.1 alpha/beta hydrolase [Bradyrhizobium sp. CCGUVB1N3]